MVTDFLYRHDHKWRTFLNFPPFFFERNFQLWNEFFKQNEKKKPESSLVKNKLPV